VTAAELVAFCRRELQARGLAPDPAAAILVSAATGIPRGRLVLEGGREAGDPRALLRGFIERMAAGEPIQYLLGTWDFFGRPFLLSRDTFIPRPETEELVEAVLRWLAPRKGPLLALDVGTGCGAIAVTLACERADLRAVAVDVSTAALRVAQENARRLGAGGRILFAAADACSALKRRERFDVVVSNPPYIAEGEWASLPAEVRDHEPARALLGGPDGLDLLRTLAASAAAHLRRGGALWCEIGAAQGGAAARLHAPGLRFEGILKDLAGRDRIARGTKE